MVGAVILAVGTGRCTIDRAQGETSPAPAATPADGAAGEAGASQRRPTGPQPLSAPEGHGAKPAAAPSPESNTSDGIVGLTRSQVKSRRGPPTAVRGAAWIYTPEQPGCREMIISEVVTFNAVSWPPWNSSESERARYAATAVLGRCHTERRRFPGHFAKQHLRAPRLHFGDDLRNH